MQCSKFTFPAWRINMSYTNNCKKYNIYPFHTGKHFLLTVETHIVSLWRGSTARQIFSPISFVPDLVHGLNGIRHEQSQHLMHLQTPNPYSHLHGFRFTDWARYSNLTDTSSYNPDMWNADSWKNTTLLSLPIHWCAHENSCIITWIEAPKNVKMSQPENDTSFTPNKKHHI